VRGRFLTLGLLLLLSCGPSELETVAKGDVFGKASASGRQAVVNVEGTYTLGAGILTLDVEADPRQKVEAHAQTRCSDDGEERSESRRESGGTPMAFPVHPDGCVACVCTVAATALLSGSGRIQVTLIGAGAGSG
jgi:hypothetical protein